MNYQPQLDNVIDMLRTRAREQILEIGEAILTFGVLITCDPRTGESIGGTGVGLLLLLVPMIRGERDKDEATMLAKAVAISGKAVACVSAFEAWVTVGAEVDANKRPLRMPSEDPNRQEAIVLMIEESSGRQAIERTVFRHDQGQIVFDNTERAPDRDDGGDPARMQGRFVILPHAPPPNKVVVAMRAFVNFKGVDVKWERLS